MNERISKLAQQAGFEYDTRDCNFYHSYPAEQLNSNINEFAELIVKECAQACLDEGAKFRGEQDITDFKLCASVIKQHFGVK